MSWATSYIADLKAGKTVQFRPRGNSMVGKINSGQLCTVEPITDDTIIKKGMILLCKVGGHQYLHLVTAVAPDKRVQISNNHGHINGWTSRNQIFGICIKVED